MTHRILAAVAYKGRVGGKRRLSGLLSPDERAELGLAMLEDVLDVLLDVPALETILLVTTETRLPDHLVRGRVQRVLDADDTLGNGDGLNLAFVRAQQLAVEAGAGALLLVPADIPAIAPADIDVILARGAPNSVVLAPDKAGLGTNALLLTPPTALRPSFGEGSCVLHWRAALDAGLLATVMPRPLLALDIDTPQDVALLLASGTECRARRYLIEIDVAARLAELLRDQARSATI